MKPKLMISVLLVILCTGLAPMEWISSGGATAEAQVLEPLLRLDIRSEIQTSSRRVNLLDLCDPMGIPQSWKDSMARTDVGESPATGHEKYINSEQFKSFLHRYLTSKGQDPAKTAIYLPERIVIKRLSMTIPREQIESIYRDFIASKAPWSAQDMEINAITYAGSLEVPAGDLTYEVVANPRERFLGNVAVTINFMVDGQKERSLRVGGKVGLFQNVLHAARLLKRNEIIRDNDLVIQKVNVSDVPDRFAIQPDQAIGKRVLRDIGLNQPVVLADIDNPLALKRGTVVTIVYEQPGLMLTAKGTAREDGSVGETIRVVNVTTNRTISCLVVDETTVQAIP